MELFRWSLYEIDRTDIESLIPFMFRYIKWKGDRSNGNAGLPRDNYADEIDWL